MIARDAARDDEMIERWYHQHHARLRSFCFRLLGDRPAAEDVAQETLLRAWARRDTFEPGADIGPWLFRVARNMCTDILRTRSRVVLCDIPDRDDGTEVSDPIERDETGALVRAALDELTERQREMLVLREIEGVGYDELAARMGISEESARAVLFRARRGLRKRVMAAMRATAMLGLWPLVRLREVVRRHLPAVEQVAASAAHAGLGIVAAVTLLVAPPVDAALIAAQGDRAVAERSEDVPPAHDIPEPAASSDVQFRTLTQTLTGGGAPATVRGSASRRGEASVHAGAENPLTEEEIDLWANVWRDANGGESVVLSTVDDTNEVACAALSASCAHIDRTLGAMEGSR